MSNLFSNLLTMSIAGSVVVGLMLLLRPATAKIFPAKWQYGIGKIAIAFFLLPVSLILGKVSFVLPQTITPRHPSGTSPVVIPEALRPNDFVDAIDTMMEKNLTAVMDKHLSLEITGAVLLIWFVGAMIFAGWHFYCFRRFDKHLLKNSIPILEDTTAALLSSLKAALGVHGDVKLMLNHKITSPMLVGLHRPMILLPAYSISETDLKLVLTHELMHLKRKDLWVKVLALIAGTLHWFNPFVHILRKDVSIWSELSCDEALASEMSHEERKHYGEAILNTLDNHSGMNTAFYSPLCESKKHIKRRLIRMLNVKKTKKSIMVLSVAAILAIGGTGLILAASSTGNDINNVIDASSTGNDIDNVINVSADKQNDSNIDVKYLWPVTGRNRITAAYGNHMHPVKKEMVFHNGIDIPAPEGTPVLNADKGTVAEIGDNETDGNYVILNHGGGIQTFYSKLFGFAEGLAEGDTVQQGDVIGYVGSTGVATGPHLHFRLIIDGEYTDPTSAFASEDWSDDWVRRPGD
ncbi:M23/M56 family metallopeptidase [Tissierella praeacuta]|uniref:M23/M56 family metallopeptidase n=1 Tax=Tissierella praeacuta TaxID=43131 RepID=UPI0010512EDA|nr:M23/M56 family metallopeptidase [Tissierella praeacuta]